MGGKSVGTLQSNRKGVYGGGVRYFTPHKEEEETSEEDESYEEETENTFPTDQEEDTAYHTQGKMTTAEAGGSDLGSLFSETEDCPQYYPSGGVDSVASSYTS